MCSLVAESFLEQDDTDTAQRLIGRSLQSAETYDLAPELAAALLVRGKLNERRKDWEQCFADYRRALHVHKKIAASIPAADDAMIYQRKRHVQYLAAGIKRLSEILGSHK